MILLFLLAYFTGASARHCQNQITINKKIINGWEVNKYEYPYVVAILEYDIHICGGTIISRKFILTAAHCLLKRKEFYRIIAGTKDLTIVVHRRLIEQIILHPNFEYSTGFVIYDIAIAQMNDALPLITYRIWPIRLPRAFEEIPDEYGVVLGYGETDDPRLKSGAILMGVHLIKQNCQVADHFFCLGHPDGNKDSCDGDSGGPFIINKTLYGIVSHSLSPYCAKGDPGVYVNVPYFVKWIMSTILKPPTKKPKTISRWN